MLPWQHPWLQALSLKNQISPLANFFNGTGGLPRNRHSSLIVVTLSIKADLHGTTLSHATSLRQDYEMNCFV